MPFKPHPTDPDKCVFVKPEYLIDGWKKPWIGLTDEEAIEIALKVNAENALFGLVNAIEAKLKEKNYK